MYRLVNTWHVSPPFQCFDGLPSFESGSTSPAIISQFLVSSQCVAGYPRSIQHYSRSRIPVFLLEKTLLVERQFYAAECSDSLKSNPDICHTQSLVYLPLTPLDHLDFSKNRLCPFISRLTKMLAHSFMAINQGKSREFCTNPAASFHSN